MNKDVDGANDKQELRRPEMQVAHKTAEADLVGQSLYRVCGFAWSWEIKEHFERTRDKGHQQEGHGRSSCSRGVTPE